MEPFRDEEGVLAIVATAFFVPLQESRLTCDFLDIDRVVKYVIDKRKSVIWQIKCLQKFFVHAEINE